MSFSATLSWMMKMFLMNKTVFNIPDKSNKKGWPDMKLIHQWLRVLFRKYCVLWRVGDVSLLPGFAEWEK